MKIEGGSGAGAAGGAAGPRTQAATGFSPPAAGLGEAVAASPAGPLHAVSSLGALLALQEAPGPMERRRRAVRRAGRLLDILDAVKLSLLDGADAAPTLSALKGAVAERRGETDDPRLEGVLDEIETRAAVELAKADMARLVSVRAA